MSLTEADFHGPYVDPKTGYEYENFGAWFAREAPLRNARNDEISAEIFKAEYHKRLNRHFDDVFGAAFDRALTLKP